MKRIQFFMALSFISASCAFAAEVTTVTTTKKPVLQRLWDYRQEQHTLDDLSAYVQYELDQAKKNPYRGSFIDDFLHVLTTRQSLPCDLLVVTNNGGFYQFTIGKDSKSYQTQVPVVGDDFGFFVTGMSAKSKELTRKERMEEILESPERKEILLRLIPELLQIDDWRALSYLKKDLVPFFPELMSPFSQEFKRRVMKSDLQEEARDCAYAYIDLGGDVQEATALLMARVDAAQPPYHFHVFNPAFFLTQSEAQRETMPRLLEHFKNLEAYDKDLPRCAKKLIEMEPAQKDSVVDHLMTHLEKCEHIYNDEWLSQKILELDNSQRPRVLRVMQRHLQESTYPEEINFALTHIVLLDHAQLPAMLGYLIKKIDTDTKHDAFRYDQSPYGIRKFFFSVMTPEERIEHRTLIDEIERQINESAFKRGFITGEDLASNPVAQKEFFDQFKRRFK